MWNNYEEWHHYYKALRARLDSIKTFANQQRRGWQHPHTKSYETIVSSCFDQIDLDMTFYGSRFSAKKADISLLDKIRKAALKLNKLNDIREDITDWQRNSYKEVYDAFCKATEYFFANQHFPLLTLPPELLLKIGGNLTSYDDLQALRHTSNSFRQDAVLYELARNTYEDYNKRHPAGSSLGCLRSRNHDSLGFTYKLLLLGNNDFITVIKTNESKGDYIQHWQIGQKHISNSRLIREHFLYFKASGISLLANNRIAVKGFEENYSIFFPQYKPVAEIFNIYRLKIVESKFSNDLRHELIIEISEGKIYYFYDNSEPGLALKIVLLDPVKYNVIDKIETNIVRKLQSFIIMPTKGIKQKLQVICIFDVNVLEIFELKTGGIIIFIAKEVQGEMLITLGNGKLISINSYPLGGFFKEEKLTNLYVWDLPCTKPIIIYNVHQDDITAIQVLPNNRFATASKDKTIKIWNADHLNVLMTLYGDSGVTSLALLPSQYGINKLMAAYADDAIKIWRI